MGGGQPPAPPILYKNFCLSARDMKLGGEVPWHVKLLKKIDLCTRPIKFIWPQHFFNENPKNYLTWAILIDNLRADVEAITGFPHIVLSNSHRLFKFYLPEFAWHFSEIWMTCNIQRGIFNASNHLKLYHLIYGGCDANKIWVLVSWFY